VKQTLFKQGEFISHAGLTFPFKIECDALTDEDIECVAEYIAAKMDCRFMVQGISRGGCRLAATLEKYEDTQAPFVILIVDDVLTTSSSMEKAKAEQPPQVCPLDVVGWVIFARTKPPSWANVMFVLGD
jgi:orotate phosphoribosyltransferase